MCVKYLLSNGVSNHKKAFIVLWKDFKISFLYLSSKILVQPISIYKCFAKKLSITVLQKNYKHFKTTQVFYTGFANENLILSLH